MYPLKNAEKIRRGYTFGVPTFYNNFHIGLDFIVPVGTPIYAVFDGSISNSVGVDGGNTVVLSNGVNSVRCLHLSKHVTPGKVKQGDIIGYSGNTGKSTGPHVHVDCWKGKVSLNDKSKMINPEIFFKQIDMLELIKGDGPEIYAVGKDGQLIHIIDEQTLISGTHAGLWGNTWTVKPQSEVDKLPKGKQIKFL